MNAIGEGDRYQPRRKLCNFCCKRGKTPENDEMLNWILWTNVEKDWELEYHPFGVFWAGQWGKSTGISPIWSRKMIWKETEQAGLQAVLLMEVFQRGSVRTVQ